MTFYVKLNGQILSVPSGAIKHVVYGIINSSMNIEQAKNYLAREKLSESAERSKELGYVNFDDLTEDGKPTIVGEFYQKNSVVGLKLSGKLKIHAI